MTQIANRITMSYTVRMKLSVIYDISTEAGCLYFTGYDISRGFFLKNGWYPVPLSIRHNQYDPVILMPDINYNYAFKNIKSFKNDLSKLYVASDKELKPITEELIKTDTFIKLSPPEINGMQNQYSSILLSKETKIKQVFDILNGIEFEVIIYPTNFGSPGAFTIFDINEAIKSKTVKIYLSHRIDMPKEDILEKFVSSITRSLSTVGENWDQSEAISDFVTQDILGHKNHIGTIKLINKQNKYLLENSIKFLLKNGLPTGDIFTYDPERKCINLFDKNINENLSPLESKLLTTLIKNKGEIVTFDQIADNLYLIDADLKFSLWGIIKTVQRIRSKLEDFGIPKEAIQNVRGEGYKLMI